MLMISMELSSLLVVRWKCVLLSAVVVYYKGIVLFVETGETLKISIRSSLR